MVATDMTDFGESRVDAVGMVRSSIAIYRAQFVLKSVGTFRV